MVLAMIWVKLFSTRKNREVKNNQNNMVTLHTPEIKIQNGRPWPMMRKHNLTVKKAAPNFDEGEKVECFIAKYLDGKYAVWASTWKPTNKYHVFNSEQELHDHFDEL